MKRVTVLVIEDQAQRQALIADHLTRKGYTVLEAIGCKEAFIKLKQCRTIDFVISATALQNGDGIRLIKHVKKSDWQVPVWLHHDDVTFTSTITGESFTLSRAFTETYFDFAHFERRVCDPLKFLKQIETWLAAEQAKQSA